MNALHLFWIIPIASIFGFFICAFLTVIKIADNNKQTSITEEALNNIERDIYKSMPLAYAEKVIDIIKKNINKPMNKN